MKTTIATLLIITCLLGSAFAASLAWDMPPAAQNIRYHRIWKKVGTTYTELSGSPVLMPIVKFTLTSPVVGDIYAVSAVNDLGESSKSEVTIPATATPPVNLKVTP